MVKHTLKMLDHLHNDFAMKYEVCLTMLGYYVLKDEPSKYFNL